MKHAILYILLLILFTLPTASAADCLSEPEANAFPFHATLSLDATNYYLICNAKQLAAIDQNDETRAGNYLLGQDIDLSQYIADQGSFQIGRSGLGSEASELFTGIFNGNGQSISGYKDERKDDYYVALFGAAEQALFKNITIKNSHVLGKYYVSILVGKAVACQFENIKILKSSARGHRNVGLLAGSHEKIAAHDDRSNRLKQEIHETAFMKNVEVSGYFKVTGSHGGAITGLNQFLIDGAKSLSETYKLFGVGFHGYVVGYNSGKIMNLTYAPLDKVSYILHTKLSENLSRALFFACGNNLYDLDNSCRNAQVYKQKKWEKESAKLRQIQPDVPDYVLKDEGLIKRYFIY